MYRVNGTTTALRPSSTAVQHHTLEARGAAPILITEQEVLFSTAAAGSLQPTTKRWFPAATGAVLAAIHGIFQRSTADRVGPRHHPKHYEFLERACMGREMDRL
jgi:hypothetical protein